MAIRAGIKDLEKLAHLLLKDKRSQKEMKEAYVLKDKISNYYAMVFNRNTLTQLKSTGGMTLISNRNVVDNLNILDNFISSASIQLDDMRNFTLQNLNEMGTVFFMGYNLNQNGWTRSNEAFEKLNHIKFLTNERAKIANFGYRVFMQSTIYESYIWFLIEINKYQARLIKYLEKEYDLNY